MKRSVRDILAVAATAAIASLEASRVTVGKNGLAPPM
jgi:hypothetical protein